MRKLDFFILACFQLPFTSITIQVVQKMESKDGEWKKATYPEELSAASGWYNGRDDTVLWKSNANELQRNSQFSWLFGEISLEKKSLRQFVIFRRILTTSIVSIRTIFRAVIRGLRQHAANFRTLIRSTWKFEGNFQAKIRAVSCKVRCNVNRNHSSRCSVVAAWNISSITSRCSEE